MEIMTFQIMKDVSAEGAIMIKNKMPCYCKYEVAKLNLWVYIITLNQ